MKYLKKIFEKFSQNDIDEIKEISENHLAYLLDQDFYLGVDYAYRNSGETDYDIIEIDIHNPDRPKFGKSLKWELIKDHVIPFIELLKNKHFKKIRLANINIHFWIYEEDSLNVDSSKLIDDDKETLEILKNKDISCISLQVKRGL